MSSGRTIVEDGVVHLSGGPGDDYLVATRSTNDTSSHSSSMVSGHKGNDTLSGENEFNGQIHMYGAGGDDHFILDVTNQAGHQGHHTYGGTGQNVFEFVDIGEADYPIVGRLDDYNPTRDTIMIEGREIDLEDLPAMISLEDGSTVSVRVILYEQPELEGTGLGPQQILQIGDNIFYSLEGARDLVNSDIEGSSGEERHFLPYDSIEEMRQAPTHQYENPEDFVPYHLYSDRIASLNEMEGGHYEVNGTSGADYVHGGKVTVSGERTGGQVYEMGDGDDVVDANTGNDLIYGGAGNDLLSGGIDNDTIHGGHGDDTLWGGTGNDRLDGGHGDDVLFGGRGEDTLVSSDGDDTLAGGLGDDTYSISGTDGRNVSITEDEDGGFDHIDVDGSFDMKVDAKNVESAKLSGTGDADLIGNEGDNILVGNSGDNVLNGMSGDDVIEAGGGNNTLVGGGGDDHLIGGDGTNRFHFANEDGADLVSGFNIETDNISFQQGVDPESILIGEDDHGNVVIFYDEESSIVLEGIGIDEFEEWSEARMEGENPLVVIEPEMDDHGHDHDQGHDHDHDHHMPLVAADLADPVGDGNRPDWAYTNAPFDSDAPGGHTYGQADRDKIADPDSGDDSDEEEDDFPIPQLPPEEDEEDDVEDEDQNDAGGGVDMTCFVATAAYADPHHPDVVWLRKFRDERLVNYFLGRKFIAFYWYVGPIMAAYVRKHPSLAGPAKSIISRLVRLLRK